MTTTTTIYTFGIRPSPEQEVPMSVLDEWTEGTLTDAQALCKQYHCKIILTDVAGFECGWVKPDDYRITGAHGGPERRHLRPPN